MSTKKEKEATQETKTETATETKPEVKKEEKKPYVKFHPTDLKGLSLKEAEAQAEEEKHTYRILKEDGKDLPEGRDYDSRRINVEVEKGIISKVYGTW